MTMKRHIISGTATAVAVACIGLFGAGCGLGKNISKHIHSATTGLDRKITLYAADGHIIKEWRTTAQIEDQGGSVQFIVDGKSVYIAGTFTVEEQ